MVQSTLTYFSIKHFHAKNFPAKILPAKVLSHWSSKVNLSNQVIRHGYYYWWSQRSFQHFWLKIFPPKIFPPKYYPPKFYHIDHPKLTSPIKLSEMDTIIWWSQRNFQHFLIKNFPAKNFPAKILPAKVLSHWSSKTN